MTLDETVLRGDKKARLNRIPSRTQPDSEVATAAEPNLSVSSSKAVAPFEPREREPEDTPPDGEKWDAKRDREKQEAAEALVVEARMTETEQLGLDTGRCAARVKALRSEMKRLERNLVSTREKLSEAESTLVARLDELRNVGL